MLLREGLSETDLCCDLVYKLRKLIGKNDFSFQFRKINTRYRRIGYNLNIMRQSACLVFNPIMVDNNAALLNCTPVGRASDSMMSPSKSCLFYLASAGASCLLLDPTGRNWCFLLLRIFSKLFNAQGSLASDSLLKL